MRTASDIVTLTAVLAATVVGGCGGVSTVAPDAPDAGPQPAYASSLPASGGHDVSASSAPAWTGALVDRCRELEPLMRAAAAEHGLDVGLIAGIIRVESSFRPEVVSRAGAIGLMQVMPRNGERLGCGDLADPEHNIQCGVTVLKRFLKHYDQEIIYALSGYHSGYRRPNEARAAGTLPSDYSYVEKVLAARTSYLRDGCAP